MHGEAVNKIQNMLEFYSKTMAEFGDVPMSSRLVEVYQETHHNKKQTINHKPNSQNNIADTSHKIASKPSVNIMETKQIKADSKPTTTLQPIPQINLDSINTLDELKSIIQNTTVCDIQQFATNMVFGDGNPNAKILIIGEAPGQEEDEKGIPFCGRSGELLMNAFRSIKMERDSHFYITNNIFWRPPGNRKPTDEELLACKPYLGRIIEIIKPQVILCVGGVASMNVLETEESISILRKKTFNTAFPSGVAFQAKIHCIYHPSYLLRNPSKKYEMYQDLLHILPNIQHLL